MFKTMAKAASSMDKRTANSPQEYKGKPNVYQCKHCLAYHWGHTKHDIV